MRNRSARLLKILVSVVRFRPWAPPPLYHCLIAWCDERFDAHEHLKLDLIEGNWSSSGLCRNHCIFTLPPSLTTFSQYCIFALARFMIASHESCSIYYFPSRPAVSMLQRKCSGFSKFCLAYFRRQLGSLQPPVQRSRYSDAGNRGPRRAWLSFWTCFLQCTCLLGCTNYTIDRCVCSTHRNPIPSSLQTRTLSR